jgi:hypothetical protein
MIAKIKMFIRPFCTGLFAGATAHAAGSILVFSIDELMHFMGHVVAGVALRMIR